VVSTGGNEKMPPNRASRKEHEENNGFLVAENLAEMKFARNANLLEVQFNSRDERQKGFLE
jgi:hypothetical protein